jgi:hypothetical protein
MLLAIPDGDEHPASREFWTAPDHRRIGELNENVAALQTVRRDETKSTGRDPRKF